MWLRKGRRLTKEQKKHIRNIKLSEKARWRYYERRDREKRIEAYSAWSALHPSEKAAQAKHMISMRDPDHLDKIIEQRMAVKEIAEKAGCSIALCLKADELDAAYHYFEKLIENRAIIKKSRSQARSSSLGVK